MATIGNKRRKTEHVSSGDDGEEEEASFASFCDSDSPDAEMTASDAEAGNESDEEEDDTVNEKEPSTTHGNRKEMSDAASRKTKLLGSTKIGTNASQKNSYLAQSRDQSMLSGASFKSSVFKLQVDELLQQIRPRQGKLERDAESALHTLKKSIEQMQDRTPLPIDQAELELIKHKVAIPFPDPRPPKDAKYKLAFARPANINVVGSFAMKTSPRSSQGAAIDMTLTMPSSLFEEKDYLNYRYFYKRAYYLACVASNLKSSHKSDFSIEFQLLHNDPLKAVLVVGPGEKKDTSDERTPRPKWRINILPCISDQQFAAEKLRPEKNNLRNIVQPITNQADCQPEPTAFYNSSLRADMLMGASLKLLHNSKKSCEGFLDACLLGCTWLRQRDFGSSIDKGGFGNFEWAALMALCLQGGGPAGRSILSPGYSSYQLFKATLQFLAVKDLAKASVSTGQADAPKPVQKGVPVLWDPSASHNLLYKMSPWSYKLLRHEARITLTALGDQISDGFDATFISQVRDPLLRFDQVIEIPQIVAYGISHDGNAQKNLTRLYEVLTRGLGDRVNQFIIMFPPYAPWNLGSSRPNMAQRGTFKLCMMVNSATVRRTVDHGPSAENKADAAVFREFWGEKAELRRFKDGSILESLVWSPNEEGRSVLEQIVRYLLIQHFDVNITQEVSFSGQRFQSMIKGGNDLALFEPIMARYNQFENDLRGLHELPLSIRQIAPADAQLRYAYLRGIANGRMPLNANPVNVVIQFEGSARWPDDLAAIQQTKIAFLLKIKELLDESVASTTSRIGLENEDQDVLNQAFLEVTYTSDASFRLRIHHDREQTLLERQLKDKSLDPKSKEVAATGLAKYKRDYLKAPAHTQAVAQLCKRYPILSGTIRLMKHWFGSHLLSEHVAEEVIELLVVRTFTQPWPWQMPSSIQTGFLRTLAWLSRWDWRADPLVVDLSESGELKPPMVQAITTRFEAWRKLDPALHRVALFVASNLDHDGNTWTDGRPAMVVASRMTALAKAACVEIREKQLQLDPYSLFSSPLTDFDFALHLHPHFCGAVRNGVAKQGQFRNLELATLDDPDQVDYQPAQDFLTELEAAYGSVIMFFSGGNGSKVIAGLWNPQTATRAWKVNLAYSTTPSKVPGSEEPQASINKNAMLSEIARLGGDLIQRVEVFAH